MDHIDAMETRRLTYFLKMVEHGSITKAARALGVAQPALSQQLGVLEHELKAKLLVRSRSGVLPTAAGLRLYERAKRIVREVGALEREMGGETRSGIVSVGLVPSVMPVLGLPFLQAILREQPTLSPQIVEAPGYALREQLQRGLVEVAVLPTSLISRDLQVAEIYRDELQIIAAPSRRINELSPRDLAMLPWFVTRSPAPARNTLSVWFARHGLEPKIVAEVDSQPLVVEAVRANMGVALLSALSIPPYFDHTSIQALPFPGWLEERVYLACWRTDAAAGAVPPSVELLVRIGQQVMAKQAHI